MTVRLIDAPRDLLVGDDNDLVVTAATGVTWSRGLAAVKQSCRIALQLFAGEWFLNLAVGIPYWESILAQKPAIAIKAANIAFRSALLAVDDVLAVTRMDIIYDGSTRRMKVTWAVSTTFGETSPDTLAPIGVSR